MLRLFIIIGVAILVIVTVRWLLRQPAKVRWQFAAFMVAIGLLIMVVTGRAHWIAVVFAAMLPFFRALLTVLNNIPILKRLLDVLGVTQSSAQQNSGQSSTVQSRYFRMSLDHDTGEMNGEILEGTFTGRTLGELTLEQLRQLLDECQGDEESVALLVAYLDRKYESEWQQQDNETRYEQTSTTPGNMSHDEALEILGLSPGASEEEIIGAHRRLIQNLHPDRGGSAYLAAKINLAKDILLGQ